MNKDTLTNEQLQMIINSYEKGHAMIVPVAYDYRMALELKERRGAKGANQPSMLPEKLPCPVVLEPGLKFGKGVPVSTMLKALQRRADYNAEIEAMTPEEREAHESAIAEFKSLLPQHRAVKKLTVTLPDPSSKAFWSGTGKSETFHHVTYRNWVKESIQHGCAIAGIKVEVK